MAAKRKHDGQPIETDEESLSFRFYWSDGALVYYGTRTNVDTSSGKYKAYIRCARNNVTVFPHLLAHIDKVAQLARLVSLESLLVEAV